VNSGSRRKSGKALRPKRSGRFRALLAGGLALALVGAAGWFLFARPKNVAPQYYVTRPRGSVTFNKNIAPIVFENCGGCHRPGEAGPFNLLTYVDVSKRAKQIAEVTKSRLMPPWLPEDGHEEFLDKRRLSVEQIGLINQWAAEGAPEGNAADLPPLPKWTEGWQLGPPDLVVTMPESYSLPADGVDVYRNFIIPVPTTEKRFVWAVELRPSSKAVHHAFIRIDPTRESRRLDEKDPGPGFGGMTKPPTADTPAGHFLGWQPGRGPARAPDGLAWTLPAGADVVLLMHMQPRGKREMIRPSIGFYFTETPPTNTPTKISIFTYDIDIPAGATNYTIEQTFSLPVDVDLLSILPHCHYLGRRLEGFAMMPDQSRKTLLVIPDWDFNWQSDYRYEKPVYLPKGTQVGLRFSYDNSTNNVRNPNQPPTRVKYGLQTTNEMGELHLQILAHHPEEQPQLEEALNQYALKDIVTLNQHRLRENRNDTEALVEIAKAKLMLGDAANAVRLLQRLLAGQPGNTEAHYTLGIALMDRSNYREAEAQFLETLTLDPENYRARNNAGICSLRLGKLDDAAAHFQEALRLHPGDTIAEANLRLAVQARRGQSGK